jgi:hypothetical protein
MISPKPSAHEGPRRAFLVERYLSPAAAEDLAESTARVARLCADAEHSDTGVRYLYSAYLPTEDTCFCLFRAESSDAVRAVNDQAHFPLDRVTDAALLVCVENETRPDHPAPRARI